MIRPSVVEAKSSSKNFSASAEKRAAKAGWFALALPLTVGFCLSCAGASPTAEEGRAAASPEKGVQDDAASVYPSVSASSVASASPVESAAAAPKEVVPPPPPELFAGAPFPPADYAPLHKRTAKPDDGKWQVAPEGARAGQATIYQSTVHPHRIKKWVYVTVLAFDRRHLTLKLVAGTHEPESKTVPSERRSGLVPAAEQGALVAVFNGGFKVRHGNYGMMVDGDIFAPPIDDACGLALNNDGELRIGAWPDLASTMGEMRWYRQTPPCLVAKGELNPRLPSEFRTRKWGAAVGGARDIRRSAVGLDASGRTLFYAFGDWVTAGELATALQAAGVVEAAQLDINWSYTRFFWFEKLAEGPRIKSTIMPKLKYSRNRYVEKPSYRDFFYLSWRP